MKRLTPWLAAFMAVTCSLALPTPAGAWPYDGYDETGIRRLEYVRLMIDGELEGTPPKPGARLPTEAVDLRLRNVASVSLPAPDEALSSELKALLAGDASDYGIALLDMTDPENLVYAAWQDDYRQNVGSVGKLLGALGLFQALADTYPEGPNERVAVLRNTTVTADDFSQSDHHTVRLFDVESRELTRRSIRIGDRASLWEYLDWMLSVSSNSAAAMVMREAMMLRAEGRDYPLADEDIDAFFDQLGSGGRTELFQQTFWEPVTRNGMDLDEIRQGSFFTRGGKNRVNGGGNSYATAHSLMQLVLKMEQGRLVDDWTSLQLKRLIYLTERRIRYASSPALDDAAVYFKSGSLYQCREEPGFDCGAYRGNVINYMNSVAIIEEQTEAGRLHYAVTLISNVLRENSAVAHQTLATRVHRMMQARHTTPDRGYGARPRASASNSGARVRSHCSPSPCWASATRMQHG